VLEIRTDQRITSGLAARTAAFKDRIHGCTRTFREKVRFFSLAPRAPSIHGTSPVTYFAARRETRGRSPAADPRRPLAGPPPHNPQRICRAIARAHKAYTFFATKTANGQPPIGREPVGTDSVRYRRPDRPRLGQPLF
jgi:hypothetical protein